MNNKAIMLRGLPASGKTTYAKNLQKGNTDKYKRVNKDDLRSMIDDGVWSKENEKFILEVRNCIVDLALINGYNIIVDDTNMEEKHINKIKEIADINECGFDVVDIKTDVDECIKRDMFRENSVGSDVIIAMNEKYILKKEKQNEKLKPAIIVDIDGTLAHAGDRGIFDYNKVWMDNKDIVVADIISKYYQDYFIIIVSGREATCRNVTEQWLSDNNIFYNELYMRNEKDHRPDTIVKKEIYDNFIKNKYNIKFVLDDRNCVVKMWRDLGLKCLQVQDGDF